MNYKIMQFLMLGLAFLCFGLGAVGALLPVVPTTPFLLVASFLFTKSSRRFNRWFKSTRLYKNYLETFINDRMMTLGAKIFVLLPISISLMTIIIAADLFVIKAGIWVLIGIQYIYFIFFVDTIYPWCSKKIKK